jgi:hypothetical protein
VIYSGLAWREPAQHDRCFQNRRIESNRFLKLKFDRTPRFLLDKRRVLALFAIHFHFSITIINMIHFSPSELSLPQLQCLKEELRRNPNGDSNVFLCVSGCRISDGRCNHLFGWTVNKENFALDENSPCGVGYKLKNTNDPVRSVVPRGVEWDPLLLEHISATYTSFRHLGMATEQMKEQCYSNLNGHFYFFDSKNRFDRLFAIATTGISQGQGPDGSTASQGLPSKSQIRATAQRPRGKVARRKVRAHRATASRARGKVIRHLDRDYVIMVHRPRDSATVPRAGSGPGNPTGHRANADRAHEISNVHIAEPDQGNGSAVGQPAVAVQIALEEDNLTLSSMLVDAYRHFIALKNQIRDLVDRIGAAEDRIGAAEDRFRAQEVRIRAQEDQLRDHEDRIAVLEQL